jgi:MraZ protein
MQPQWYPLLGEHDLTIDDKGRLLVPADIRKRLEQSGENDTLILMKISGRLFLYPEKFQLGRYASVRVGVVPTEQEQRLLRGLFGPSLRLTWDKQGRILLSPKTMGSFKLDREITLVCAGDHLELWNRQEWADEQGRVDADMPGLLEAFAGRFGAGE